VFQKNFTDSSEKTKTKRGKRNNFPYMRRCQHCGTVYRANSKMSRVCDDCKKISEVKRLKKMKEKGWNVKIQSS